MSRATVTPGQPLFVPCVVAYELNVLGTGQKAHFDAEESNGQVGVMPVYADEAQARADYPDAEIMEIVVPLEATP